MSDDVAADALHMTSPLRTGRRVGRHLYAQLGPEPSGDDPPVGTVDSPVLAERIVRAVNAAAPVARPIPRDEARKLPAGTSILGCDEGGKLQRFQGTTHPECLAPGKGESTHFLVVPAPAQPAVATEGQGAAATEPNPPDPGEGYGVDSTSGVTAVEGQRVGPARDPAAVQSVFWSLTEMRGDETVPLDVRGRLAELADTLGPACVELSGGGADGGGEDEELAAIRDELHGYYERNGDSWGPEIRTRAIAGRMVRGREGDQRQHRKALARLARAAGVSPDSEDVVGEIEAAIRAGREPEMVEPTALANEHEELPGGSLGLAEWKHEAGDRVTVNRDREVLVWPGRGHYALAPEWLGKAVLAATHWAEHLAPLERGEAVEDAAILDGRAAVGTIVEDANANVGRRTEASDGEVLGWGIAGLEGTYRADEFTYPVRVVRVGTGGGETGE